MPSPLAQEKHSTGTGPTAAAHGTQYMYTETSRAGTLPNVLASYAAATTTVNEWALEVITGLPATGNIQLQFQYTCGGGFLGDTGIDKVCFR